MRRLVIITALFFAGAAFAQPGPQRPQQDPEQRFERLVTVLELSPDQQPKVRAILEATHQERRAMQQATREQHQALREKTEQRLALVLSEKQLQRFEALRPKRGPPPHEQGAGNR